MKRLICALMVALFVGGVLGCKSDDDKKKKKKEEPEKEKEKEKE